MEKCNMRGSIVLDSPSFTFNASHFLAFPSDVDDETTPWICEPIHGHDFKAEATVEGPLDVSGCVVDFLLATKALDYAIAPWKHKLILATHMPNVKYDGDDESVTIDWQGRPDPCRWVFPRSSVVWLNAVNASTETIAAATLTRFRSCLWNDEAFKDPEKYRFSLRLQEAPGAWAQVALDGAEPAFDWFDDDEK